PQPWRGAAPAGSKQALGQPALAGLVARDLALFADRERLAGERADRRPGLRSQRQQRVTEGHRVGTEAIRGWILGEMDRHRFVAEPALCRAGEGGATGAADIEERAFVGAERKHAHEGAAFQAQADALAQPRD